MQETPDSLLEITSALLESLLSPSELAVKVEQAVREAIETVKQSLDSELEFDVFLVFDGREVRFVMEPVRL